MSSPNQEQASLEAAAPAGESKARSSEKPKAANKSNGGDNAAKSAPAKGKSGKKTAPAKKVPHVSFFIETP